MESKKIKQIVSIQLKRKLDPSGRATAVVKCVSTFRQNMVEMNGLKLGIRAITLNTPNLLNNQSQGIDDHGWDIRDDGYASISFESFEGDSSQVGSLLGSTNHPDYISFDYEITRLDSVEPASEDIEITSGTMRIEAGGSYSSAFQVKFKPDAKVEASEKYQIRLSNPTNIELADLSNIECGFYCDVPFSPSKGVYEFTTKSESHYKIQWKIDEFDKFPLIFYEGEKFDLTVRSNLDKDYEGTFEKYNINIEADRDLSEPSDMGGEYANTNDFKPFPYWKKFLSAESSLTDGSKLKLSTPIRIKKDKLKEGKEALYLNYNGSFDNSDLDTYVEIWIKDSEDINDISNEIIKPSIFKSKFIDKITNFNPVTDALEINADSFGIDSYTSFAAGKNKREVKRKLAKQDYDFIYDQKKGGLYFNENGADKDFGDGGIIAILKGAPDLTAGNLELI